MKQLPSILIASALLAASLLFSSSSSLSTSMAEEGAAVYIIFVDEPLGEEPEAFHIRTLAAVLGRSVLRFPSDRPIEEAARRAILFHYTHAASGFAAKLTPEQVEELKKQPGVIQVMPSRTYSIDEPTSGAHQVQSKSTMLQKFQPKTKS
ncbi:hypothetical protein MUK42_24548 [Musa troglodytarum]|uniref:Inhibitor I9 domain-containing protein n=1 Tax=Musa troglodytarum TaxID=320322 RepID=A0A9E7KU91_9LILI|nr:hypothetical protein MUK42_24548 [Musa troglodytarum]